MIRIGIIGDREDERSSHLATEAALDHAAASLGQALEYAWLPTKQLLRSTKVMERFSGFWGAPGTPYISREGALNGIYFARQGGYPFLGTCGGFQYAVMEFAIQVLGMKYVTHAEYDAEIGEYFITQLRCPLPGEARRVFFAPNSLARAIYGTDSIDELYNCNFGLNPAFQEQLHQGGFKVAGSDEGAEARCMELAGMPFYMATLFQPQLSSRPDAPHPLIVAFLRAAMGQPAVG